MSSEENKKETQSIALFDNLVDLVLENHNPVFLMRDEHSFKTVCDIDLGDLLLVPPSAQYLPWAIPRSSEVMKKLDDARSDTPTYLKSVFALVEQTLRATAELPSDRHYLLLAAWVVQTYIVDKFQYSAFIALFALPERGKTRLLKALIWMSYRGFYTETMRVAFLIRVVRDLGCTIGFDVMDLAEKLRAPEVQDVILTRFERGAKVPRVTAPEKSILNGGLDFFGTYGASIFAMNEPADDTFNSRSLGFNMPESNKPFDNLIVEEDLLPIRESLVAARALLMDMEFEDIPKVTKGRLGDITKPLVQVIKLFAPDRENELRELINELANEKRLTRAESPDAQIVRVIAELLPKAQNARIPVKQITDLVNLGRQQRYHASYHAMGRKLTAFGFEKGQSREGNAVIIVNEDQITNLFRRFGVVVPEARPIAGFAGLTGLSNSRPTASADAARSDVGVGNNGKL